MTMGDVDSCYSWAVALAGCVIFMITSCPVRLGAQLFVSLLDRYDASRKEASFPFVLSLVVRSLSGPFAGVLGDRLGLQGVSILGCVISAVGVAGCFFAEDITAINICLGLVYGLGYGWSNALVPEILNHHFIKHRSKAYGVYLAGGGLGSFILPPVLELILYEFGVSGTFLILGAIVLNTLPAAILLTVPKMRNKRDKKENSIPPSTTEVSLNASDQIENNFDSTASNIALEDFKAPFKNTSENIFGVKNLPVVSRSGTDACCQISVIQLKNGELEQVEKDNSFAINDFHKDISTKENSFFKLKGKHKLKRGVCSSFKQSLFSTISVLWSLEFLILSLIQGINGFLNQILWTITVDFVRDKEIEKYLEVYFVMCLSLFDTIGRFTLGVIPDKGLMTVRNFSLSCFSSMGVIFLSLTWLPEFFSLITAYVLMGFIIGGSTIAIPALITEFVEEEKRATAMASRLLATAPLCLTISPLIGLFRGSLGSYDGLLYLMASTCVFCIIMLLILPVITNRRDRLKMKDKL